MFFKENYRKMREGGYLISERSLLQLFDKIEEDVEILEEITTRSGMEGRCASRTQPQEWQLFKESKKEVDKKIMIYYNAYYKKRVIILECENVLLSTALFVAVIVADELDL